MSTEPYHLADGKRQTRLRRASHLLILTMAVLLGFILLGTSGCGPLGLYSLAHSLVDHHVLKPVIPDEPSPEAVRYSGDETCED